MILSTSASRQAASHTAHTRAHAPRHACTCAETRRERTQPSPRNCRTCKENSVAAPCPPPLHTLSPLCACVRHSFANYHHLRLVHTSPMRTLQASSLPFPRENSCLRQAPAAATARNARRRWSPFCSCSSGALTLALLEAVKWPCCAYMMSCCAGRWIHSGIRKLLDSPYSDGAVVRVLLSHTATTMTTTV